MWIDIDKNHVPYTACKFDKALRTHLRANNPIWHAQPWMYTHTHTHTRTRTRTHARPCYNNIWLAFPWQRLLERGEGVDWIGAVLQSSLFLVQCFTNAHFVLDCWWTCWSMNSDCDPGQAQARGGWGFWQSCPSGFCVQLNSLMALAGCWQLLNVHYSVLCGPHYMIVLPLS